MGFCGLGFHFGSFGRVSTGGSLGLGGGQRPAPRCAPVVPPTGGYHSSRLGVGAHLPDIRCAPPVPPTEGHSFTVDFFRGGGGGGGIGGGGGEGGGGGCVSLPDMKMAPPNAASTATPPAMIAGSLTSIADAIDEGSEKSIAATGCTRRDEAAEETPCGALIRATPPM